MRNQNKLISHERLRAREAANVSRWLFINKKLITKAWKIRNIFFGNKDVATERAEFISGSTRCHADSFMNFEVIFTTTFAKYKIRKFIPPESRSQASFIITISTFAINIIEIISLLVFEQIWWLSCVGSAAWWLNFTTSLWEKAENARNYSRSSDVQPLTCCDPLRNFRRQSKRKLILMYNQKQFFHVNRLKKLSTVSVIK